MDKIQKFIADVRNFTTDNIFHATTQINYDLNKAIDMLEVMVKAIEYIQEYEHSSYKFDEAIQKCEEIAGGE